MASWPPFDTCWTAAGRPDNGWEDMGANHLDAILNVTGDTMVASSFHDYQNECFDGFTGAGLLANTSCFTNRVTALKAKLEGVVERHGNALWCSECGPHSNSGVPGLTNTWTSAMWYADALGLYAAEGIGMLSRQTLLGGDYEIINRTTGLPNPDFFPAVLWHDLVGGDVYGVVLHGCERAGCRDAVRVYAQSGLQGGAGPSSVVVVALNFATTAASGFAITLAGKAPATACELWQIRGAKGATLDGITVNGARADLSLPAAHCLSNCPIAPADASHAVADSPTEHHATHQTQEHCQCPRPCHRNY